MRRPPDLTTLRAAYWTARTLRRARRVLESGRVAGIPLPAPPPLPPGGMRGVETILRRAKATCLERALIRQRWLAAQGDPRTIVIGVTAPSRGFIAHAWLLGEDDPSLSDFHELARLEP